jgi:hypothetical protein
MLFGHSTMNTVRSIILGEGMSKYQRPPLLRPPYSGYTLRSEIEAPLITREVLPETYFLLVIMAVDAQAGPFLQFQAS